EGPDLAQGHVARARSLALGVGFPIGESDLPAEGVPDHDLRWSNLVREVLEILHAGGDIVGRIGGGTLAVEAQVDERDLEVGPLGDDAASEGAEIVGGAERSMSQKTESRGAFLADDAVGGDHGRRTSAIASTSTAA